MNYTDKWLNHPQTWMSLVERLQPTTGECIIAGGAIRDNLLGGCPKDIDVFISCPDELDFEFILHDLKGKGIDCQLILPEHEDPNYSANFNGVTGVANVFVSGVTCPVQLIALDIGEFNPDTVVRQFDLNVCMSAWSMKDGFHDTPAAQYDRKNGRVSTAMKEVTAATKARAARISKRLGFKDFVNNPVGQIKARETTGFDWKEVNATWNKTKKFVVDFEAFRG